MPKKRDDSQTRPEHLPDDETSLFRRKMSDARPLKQDTIAPVPLRTRPRASFTKRDERAALRESIEADTEVMEFEGGESLSFLRPSVGLRSFRKLARGKISVQSEIDLHGLTAGEAKIQLADFIDNSIADGLRCVRVIHGKGLGSGGRGPVLKRKVDAWLRRWDAVLAFVSARQVDGGTGAVYVLLKKHAEGSSR